MAFTILAACGASSTSPPVAPITVSNLTARAVSSNQIYLHWATSSGSSTTTYRIVRNGSFLQNVNTTNFNDSGLNPDTQYCYQVYAYYSNGVISEPSDESCTVPSWIIKSMRATSGQALKLCDGYDWSPEPSIAVDSSGRVIYGCDYGGNYRILTKTQNNWLEEYPNLAESGGASSMAIDSSNKTHISYDGSYGYLYYATDASGTWEAEIIDNTLPVEFTSIAVDSSDYIHISYAGMFNDLWTIKYATNASGSWTTEILESLNVYDEYRSPNACPIATDLNGDVHISFISYDSNGESFLGYITNASGTWFKDTVFMGGDLKSYSSIAVDSAGNVNIIYNDSDDSKMKYATNSLGVWVYGTVIDWESVDNHLSLTVDSYGNLHVSYLGYRYVVSLIYAKNVSGVWESYIIDNVDIESVPTVIAAIDADDKLHIIYGRENGTLNYVSNR